MVSFLLFIYSYMYFFFLLCPVKIGFKVTFLSLSLIRIIFKFLCRALGGGVVFLEDINDG